MYSIQEKEVKLIAIHCSGRIARWRLRVNSFTNCHFPYLGLDIEELNMLYLAVKLI